MLQCATYRDDENQNATDKTDREAPMFEVIPDSEIELVHERLRNKLCIVCGEPQGDSPTTYCYDCDDHGDDE